MLIPGVNGVALTILAVSSATAAIGSAVYYGVATYNTSKRATKAMSDIRGTFYNKGVNGTPVFETGDNGEITGINRLSKSEITKYIKGKIPEYDKTIESQK